MRAGNLDRRIVIQAPTETQNSSGEPVPGWVKIHDADTLPAAVKPAKGSERFQAQQFIGREVNTFRVRYLAGVTQKHRIVYDSRTWDILDVREIGRREGLEIDAEAGVD